MVPSRRRDDLGYCRRIEGFGDAVEEAVEVERWVDGGGDDREGGVWWV